jgi:hypothetical protein
VSAGFHEFVNPSFKVNFNNIKEVMDKIEYFRKNKQFVELDKQFYDNFIINKWEQFIKKNNSFF